MRALLDPQLIEKKIGVKVFWSTQDGMPQTDNRTDGRTTSQSDKQKQKYGKLCKPWKT